MFRLYLISVGIIPGYSILGRVFEVAFIFTELGLLLLLCILSSSGSDMGKFLGFDDVKAPAAFPKEEEASVLVVKLLLLVLVLVFPEGKVD